MAIEIKGNGDVYKVEIRDRGPARVTVKVAPSKDKDGVWKSSFLDLAVWGGPGKDGKTTPGAELVHTLRERDKVTFEAWGKTDSWEKDGKPQTKLAWTVTRLALAEQTPQETVVALRAEFEAVKAKLDEAIRVANMNKPMREPDDGDSVPF